MRVGEDVYCVLMRSVNPNGSLSIYTPKVDRSGRLFKAYLSGDSGQMRKLRSTIQRVRQPFTNTLEVERDNARETARFGGGLCKIRENSKMRPIYHGGEEKEVAEVLKAK